MRNYNRLFFRLICLMFGVILVVAAQVTATFNHMVQPAEPMALLQYYPAIDPDYRRVGLLGSTFDVPVEQVKEEVQKLNAAVLVKLGDDLPIKEVESFLGKAAEETTRQAEIWWGEVVKAAKARTEKERE